MPAVIETEDLFFCHGTPACDETYMLENMGANGSTLKKSEEIMEYAQYIKQEIIFCAHTHIPRVVYLPHNKIIINPGSVGLPAYEEAFPIYHKMESGSPFANYTIVSKEQEHWLIEQVLIDYDRQGVINKSKENGRLDWTCALETGRM
ncbi:metallophosphoesterase family protein [Lysinibacillus sp. NPDC093210]|uniref:metallophosphoesterase family protein n=1 Tax=Lysinibacillus sp. NPDC093210 TaxID=3364133 RepID=UPI003801F6F8